MSNSFQAVGTNAAAPFTLKVHRGEGMVLLAMDWRNGKPPPNFAGFAIEYIVPGGERPFRVGNRIGFPGQVPPAGRKSFPSTEAPIQKFRWVHVPPDAIGEGKFRYIVTAMFWEGGERPQRGDAQTVDLELLRETLPGKLNVAFTRGFISSQAFVDRFGGQEDVIKLIPPDSVDGPDFISTHPKAAEAYRWMGYEARDNILRLLDEAIAEATEVRAIAFDLNLPEIVERLEQLGPRLKIIIDDSTDHRGAERPESRAAQGLIASAGPGNVLRQHMRNLQHHKSIAVRGPGLDRVLYGSTNFTWRGLFVQSNNAIIISSAPAVDTYFRVFDAYFQAKSGQAFRKREVDQGWLDLGVAGVDAMVAFSPHPENGGVLQDIGDDLAAATSSVFFSLAFLGQTTRGAVGPALGALIEAGQVHTMGVADARVKAGNLGLTVMSPDASRRVVRAAALDGNAPPPFRAEPSGGAGEDGTGRGTKMHHKFIVIDFDKPTARVYVGSYNFSVPADQENGENLLCIRNRTVATSYMIEALRIYDHYRFRVVQTDANTKAEPLHLKLPPDAGKQAWWQRDWDDPIRARDRALFA